MSEINKNKEQFDARETQVIRDAKFFEPYKKELRELFSALGLSDRWSDDPTANDFQSLLAGMIGKEHGNSEDKLQFSDEQIDAAKPYLEQLGMMSEHVPPVGVVLDQTVVLGGTMAANYRRTELVEGAIDDGVAVGDVLYLYGQRPREKRDGTNEEIISTDGRFGGYDISNNPWFDAYAKGALESDDPWAMTETHFGRVALNKVNNGNLVPRQINLPIVIVNGQSTGLAPKMPDVPARDVLDYDFVTDEGINITIMNTAAVARDGRPSRPKTKSTIGEWLERRAPAENAKVMLVTGNPHAIRQTQAAYQILQEYGRGDVELIVAGTSAPANTPLQTYLGEIAALIIKDVERNYSSETGSSV